MKGTSKFRLGGPDDPLVQEIMKSKGLEEVPMYRRDSPKLKNFDVKECIRRWTAYNSDRDGPVNTVKPEGVAPDYLTTLIRAKGIEIGASDVGFAELTPIMINEGSEFTHKYIISVIVSEDYTQVLNGALAVEEEAFETYVECARVSTELAAYIRQIGFAAIADHNGTGDIQAIPAMYACGMGELGRHGSLIHRQFGSSFRPGFVITDAPVTVSGPDIFGVQTTCESCLLCENNCPPAAIRNAEDFVVTNGIKRWLVDIPACYEASRFRDEYCHICVDVCPYQHRENKDPSRAATYKAFMKKRKQAGYRTPAWFIEDEENVLSSVAERSTGNSTTNK